jgi:hypothetical protein
VSATRRVFSGRYRFARASAALACLLSAVPARAGNNGAAEELFRQGQALMQAGKYEEACPKLAESQRLDPGTGTLLNLAACHEKEGKLASAWAEYNDAAALAQRDGRDDRVQYCKDHLAAIEPKLARLTISVAAGAEIPGFEVKLDDAVVGGPSLGIALPVDPGSHQISASAPGKRPWQASLNIRVGPSQEAITIQALADAPDSGEPANGPVPPPPPRAEGGSSGNTQRVVAYGLGGLGIVAVGVGTAFGLTAISKNNESNDKGCFGNQCTAPGASLRKDARSAGTLSTVAFAVGGAALAGGIALFFTAPSSEHDNRASARVVLGPGGGALAIGSTW